MTTTVSARQSVADYRATVFAERETLIEHRPDGTLVLRGAAPQPELAQRGLPDFVAYWAERRPAVAAFCERDGNGDWRSITWAELWRQVQTVGAGLLELGLGPDRPLMLLSGNSIEQAVLLLAAEYVGVPTAPVSPAYSLLSKDLIRLRGVAELTPPAALFVQDGKAFAPALAALSLPGRPVIAAGNIGDGKLQGRSLCRARGGGLQAGQRHLGASRRGPAGTGRTMRAAAHRCRDLRP